MDPRTCHLDVPDSRDLCTGGCSVAGGKENPRRGDMDWCERAGCGVGCLRANRRCRTCKSCWLQLCCGYADVLRGCPVAGGSDAAGSVAATISRTEVVA